MLKHANGEMPKVEVIETLNLENPVKVYNFEVEDFHTYHVSAYEVFVHNSRKNLVLKV